MMIMPFCKWYLSKIRKLCARSSVFDGKPAKMDINREGDAFGENSRVCKSEQP